MMVNNSYDSMVKSQEGFFHVLAPMVNDYALIMALPWLRIPYIDDFNTKQRVIVHERVPQETVLILCPTLHYLFWKPLFISYIDYQIYPHMTCSLSIY